MTPEERSLLEETHELAEENNKLLRAMKRSQRFASIMRVIYWVVIIGLSIGAYYYIQPYTDLLLKVAGSNVTNFQNAYNSLQSFLK